MSESRYIVEKNIPECVPNGNTVEDLQQYLDKVPYPEHRLVSVQFINGSFVMVWENVSIERKEDSVEKHELEDMPEKEVDDLIREQGGNPDDYAQKGREAVQGALNDRRAEKTCGLD